jgi:hypothetical protein
METPKIVGDQDGIDLWNLIYNTTDALEKAYCDSINNAATKFGLVWFTDTVTQRSKKLNNQAVWRMEWNGKDNQWEINLFHLPEGASKRSPRLETAEPEWIDVSVDDIIA